METMVLISGSRLVMGIQLPVNCSHSRDMFYQDIQRLVRHLGSAISSG